MTVEKLKPGDVLLFGVHGWGILNPIVRRLIKWGHVALYWTETKRGLPLIVESIGRGVLIRSLYSYTGRRARVMRPLDPEAGARAAKTAERLADTPAAWYGYFDIPRYVLPKLLLMKLGEWLPRRWKLVLWLMAHTYRRNSVFICSELVAQAYVGAGLPLVEEDTIPLPDDLARSEHLTHVGDLDIGLTGAGKGGLRQGKLRPRRRETLGKKMDPPAAESLEFSSTGLRVMYGYVLDLNRRVGALEGKQGVTLMLVAAGVAGIVTMLVKVFTGG